MSPQRSRATGTTLLLSIVLALACNDATGALGRQPGLPVIDAPLAYESVPNPHHFSRYLFYEDSTFALQYSGHSSNIFEYRGRFTRTDSVIAFAFGIYNTAGQWKATGVLRGDEMTIAYNDVMTMADFVGGKYLRLPVAPD